MKKTSNIKKNGMIIVLVVFVLALLIPLRKYYYTKLISEKFYNEYYFVIYEDKTEEELVRHFKKIEDSSLRIDTKDLIALDDEFKYLLEKINQTDSILIIKVYPPYLNKKISGKFSKK